ncbi:MAG: DUF624 domain-containing protein [Candidatus Choladocola sp.]|nr:DUF624 domain-containing protein [Candidatus Choladocola sp.]
MRNLFSMDSGIFRFLTRLADLMILNILFIVCCIPIVTIGASVTSLYYVTLKMAVNEEGYIAKAFLKSFRQNFRQATVIWLILLVLGCVFGIDFYILYYSEGSFFTVLRFCIGATALVYLMVLLYVFPTLARFYNSVKNTMRNALIMALADLPRTLLILVITAGSILITFLNGYTLWYGLLVWVLFGFSLVAYANSFFLNKVFAKYTPEEPSEDEAKTAETIDEES